MAHKRVLNADELKNMRARTQDTVALLDHIEACAAQFAELQMAIQNTLQRMGNSPPQELLYLRSALETTRALLDTSFQGLAGQPQPEPNRPKPVPRTFAGVTQRSVKTAEREMTKTRDLSDLRDQFRRPPQTRGED